MKKQPKEVQYIRLDHAAQAAGIQLENAEEAVRRGEVKGRRLGRHLYFVEVESLRAEAKRLGLLSRQTV